MTAAVIPQSKVDESYLGRPMQSRESDLLLMGAATFGDDIAVKPGTLYAAVYRSNHAHGLIKSVDVSLAEKMPGVRAVLTGEDVKQWSRPYINGVKQPMELWALAVDKLRYIGEPVAVVIAESRYIAEDALEAIKLEVEPLAAVTSVAAALQHDAPILHEKVGSNVLHEREFVYGDPAQAFAAAKHTLSIDINYPRNSCTPIECGFVLAQYRPGNDSYEVTSNFMGPFSMHAVMALALKTPGNRLRLRNAPNSGGSFGVKQAVFTSIVLMCLASRKAGGAPVKWVEDRLEHLSGATSANGRAATIKAAFDDDGVIQAIDIEQADDVGAYLRAPEPATLYRMQGILTGAYQIRNMRLRSRAVATNKTPSGLVRGFGGPQCYFVLERMVQQISAYLDVDPITLFERNFIPADAFPYEAAAGALLDSGDYHATMRAAVDEAKLQKLFERRAQARAQGKLYGIGYAAIVEPSISNMGYITVALSPEQRAKSGPKSGGVAAATINIDLLGSVTVIIASSPAGQGHETVCAQVVADVLGLEPEEITVNVDLDTAKDAWSVAAGNYSSRFAGAVAGTVHLAAQQIKAKICAIAAHQLGCKVQDVVLQGGQVFSVSEPHTKLPLARVASSAHWAPADLPKGMEPGMRVTQFWSPETLYSPTPDDRVNTSAAYGFAFDICGLEIDPGTGRIHIDKYITAHDAGKILNPALADGQIRGAFAQGLGAALSEEFAYSPDGNFLSGTFADYLVPTSCEVPEPIILHTQTPSPFTPLGAKGLGEGGNMSTPVCIANAVADALLAFGVTNKEIRLPLTPSRVLDLIGFADPPPSAGVDVQYEKPQTGDKRKGNELSATGSIFINASPEKVFDILMDPDALAKVIPGCKALSKTGENSYAADVTIGIGVVKASYKAQINLSEINRPHSLRLSGSGISSVGQASGSGTVKLRAQDAGTQLDYDYVAEIQGKIAAVGNRMLEGAARTILNQLFERLGRQAAGNNISTPTKTSFWRALLRFFGVSK